MGGCGRGPVAGWQAGSTSTSRAHIAIDAGTEGKGSIVLSVGPQQPRPRSVVCMAQRAGGGRRGPHAPGPGAAASGLLLNVQWASGAEHHTPPLAGRKVFAALRGGQRRLGRAGSRGAGAAHRRAPRASEHPNARCNPSMPPRAPPRSLLLAATGTLCWACGAPGTPAGQPTPAHGPLPMPALTRHTSRHNCSTEPFCAS